MKSEELNKEICSYLLDLGISSKLKGFTYIEDSIYNLIDNNIRIIKIKNVYNNLAIKYNTTSDSIERDIRYAIYKGEKNEDYDIAYDIFRNSLDVDNSKKTNKIFITTLVNYIKYELYNHY